MTPDTPSPTCPPESNPPVAGEAIAARIRAFMEREPRGGAAPAVAAGGPGDGSIPEVQAADFCAADLDRGIRRHGGLIVRGLFSSAFAEEFRQVIDRVMDACDYSISGGANQAGGDWFDPPAVLEEVMSPGELARGRVFRRNSGSVLCAEAPAVAERLLHQYERMGLKVLIAQHLGEAPCVSVKKWVLRRAVLPVNEAGWHQDGAFMGTDIKSVNLWIPLTTCGGDTGAPGMDVVPRRLGDIVSAEGAQFDWSVSDALIQSELSDTPVTSPVFAPGDAFFFDHLYLHRTQYRPAFERSRYAIETWFFGSESFPRNQIPLAW